MVPGLCAVDREHVREQVCVRRNTRQPRNVAELERKWLALRPEIAAHNDDSVHTHSD
jgi:hypothetical protein